MKHCPPCLRKWPLALFLLAACVLFFLINVHMPLCSDDYWYNYKIGTDENGKISHLVTRISSWQDLQETLFYHYFIANSRLSTAFIHLMQFIGGKSLFNLINTIAFLAFVLLAAKFCLRRINFAAVGSVMTCAILLLPNFQGTILWMSGACNYLWGAVVLIPFLSSIRTCLEGRSVGRLRLLLGMATGVLCGCIHEGLGAPLVAALVLYGLNLLLQRKGLPQPYIWLTGSVAVGLLLPISSPALWNRAGQVESPFSIPAFAGRCVSLLYKAWLPTFLAAIIVWKQRRKLRQSFYPFLVLTNFALAIAFGVSGYWGGGYFYYCLSVMLWSLTIFKGWMERHSLIVAAILIPSSLGALAYGLSFAISLNSAYQQALEAGKTEKIVSLNYLSSDHSVPWSLHNSLPVDIDIHMYPYVGNLVGQQDFYVIINTYVRDKSIYDSFADEPKNTPVAKRLGDLCIVRLPCGFFVPIRDKIKMADDTLPECDIITIGDGLIGDSLIFFWHNYFQSLMRMPRSGYGRDYHEGFHYLIIPPPACEYERVRFKMTREGNDEKQEITLPLPQKK